ncbi:hypothetical protein DUNSADRAFT_407 [Dunaliella salina]|nr:hypothetical protein DUNSADRAFT_407 [Dunaliella salina]|eukprot:KAF5827583.1 hypothetical protein DUNSADRAFT_407 [Dunaliella salina]
MATDGQDRCFTTQAEWEGDDEVIPATPSSGEPEQAGGHEELLPWQRRIPFWQVWQQQPEQQQHNHEHTRQKQRDAQRRCHQEQRERERQERIQLQHQGGDSGNPPQESTSSEMMGTAMVVEYEDEEGTDTAKATAHLELRRGTSLDCQDTGNTGYRRRGGGNNARTDRRRKRKQEGLQPKQPQQPDQQAQVPQQAEPHVSRDGGSDCFGQAGRPSGEPDPGSGGAEQQQKHGEQQQGQRLERPGGTLSGPVQRGGGLPQLGLCSQAKPAAMEGCAQLNGLEGLGELAGNSLLERESLLMSELPDTLPIEGSSNDEAARQMSDRDIFSPGPAPLAATQPLQIPSAMPEDKSAGGGGELRQTSGSPILQSEMEWVASIQVDGVADSQGEGWGHCSEGIPACQQRWCEGVDGHGTDGHEEGQREGAQGQECTCSNGSIANLCGNCLMLGECGNPEQVHTESKQQQQQQQQDALDSQEAAELVAIEQHDAEQQRLRQQQCQQQQEPSWGALPGFDGQPQPGHEDQHPGCTAPMSSNTGFLRASGRSLTINPTSLVRFRHLFSDDPEREQTDIGRPSAPTPGSQAHATKQRQPWQGQPMKLGSAFKPQDPRRNGPLTPAAARIQEQRMELMQKKGK